MQRLAKDNYAPLEYPEIRLELRAARPRSRQPALLNNPLLPIRYRVVISRFSPDYGSKLQPISINVTSTITSFFSFTDLFLQDSFDK